MSWTGFFLEHVHQTDKANQGSATCQTVCLEGGRVWKLFDEMSVLTLNFKHLR